MRHVSAAFCWLLIGMGGLLAWSSGVLAATAEAAPSNPFGQYRLGEAGKKKSRDPKDFSFGEVSEGLQVRIVPLPDHAVAPFAYWLTVRNVSKGVIEVFGLKAREEWLLMFEPEDNKGHVYLGRFGPAMTPPEKIAPGAEVSFSIYERSGSLWPGGLHPLADVLAGKRSDSPANNPNPLLRDLPPGNYAVRLKFNRNKDATFNGRKPTYTGDLISNALNLEIPRRDPYAVDAEGFGPVCKGLSAKMELVEDTQKPPALKLTIRNNGRQCERLADGLEAMAWRLRLFAKSGGRNFILDWDRGREDLKTLLNGRTKFFHPLSPKQTISHTIVLADVWKGPMGEGKLEYRDRATRHPISSLPKGTYRVEAYFVVDEWLGDLKRTPPGVWQGVLVANSIDITF